MYEDKIRLEFRNVDKESLNVVLDIPKIVGCHPISITYDSGKYHVEMICRGNLNSIKNIINNLEDKNSVANKILPDEVSVNLFGLRSKWNISKKHRLSLR